MMDLSTLRDQVLLLDKKRRTARAEALRIADQGVKEEKIALQRMLWEALKEHSVSAIHRETQMSRTTIYRYRDEYAQIAPAEVESVVLMTMHVGKRVVTVSEVGFPVTRIAWSEKGGADGEGEFVFVDGGDHYRVHWAPGVRGSAVYIGSAEWAPLVEKMEELRAETRAQVIEKGAWGI